MRIISGKYKGIQLDGFNIDGTRPTMDRIKESFIAIIQNKIKDSICLDLFAGSGSIGLELISNNCKKCYFVDNNKKVINTLNQNINKLKTTQAETINIDYISALKYFYDHHITFDIIFIDPPYQSNYYESALKIINEYNLLNNNGIIICEYENTTIDTPYFQETKERKYGSKYIKIYEKML